MNEPESSDRKNEDRSGEAPEQITELPDFYEDFGPEAIHETFFTESAQRERSIYHENLFFFTRC